MTPLLLLGLAALLAAPDAAAATPARWVQHVLGGGVEARVVTDGAPCPSLLVDGARLEMRERAAPAEAFPIRVCALALPAGTRTATLDGVPLPLPVAAPARLVVIGDTGCRGGEIQRCDDAGWPLPALATLTAQQAPQLVVHVGDFFYREGKDNPCTGPGHDCWAAWQADFFGVAGPLLAAAPLLAVRGNHEICRRGGEGWMRLLAPGPFDPARPCDDRPASGIQPPWSVMVGDRQLIVMDSAFASPDQRADPAVTAVVAEHFRAVEDMAARAPSWLLVHHPPRGVVRIGDGPPETHRDVGGNRTLLDARPLTLPPGIDLVLSGHIHLFSALAYDGALPPQLVIGNGGAAIYRAASEPVGFRFADGTTLREADSLAVHGLVLLERDADGWQARMLDRSGAARRSCRPGAGALRCNAG